MKNAAEGLPPSGPGRGTHEWVDLKGATEYIRGANCRLIDQVPEPKAKARAMAEGEHSDARGPGLCQYTLSGQRICHRETAAGSGFCIAHRSERKPEEESQFCALVSAMVGRQDYDFRGFVFASGFKGLVSATFAKTVFFEGAHFIGNAMFARAVLRGGAVFADVHIDGDAHFTGARFAENAHFLGATILGDVRFIEAEVAGAILFSSSRVGGGVDLSNAEVSGPVQFGSTVIAGGVKLSNAEVGGSVGFAHATIGADADFAGVTIGQECNFSFARIGGGAYFSGARIGKEARFGGADIGGTAVFRNAVVGGNLLFRGACIGGNAIFSELEALGNADFHGFDVGRRAYFSKARFTGKANFHAARLGMFVRLTGAVFQRSVDLSGTSPPPAGHFNDLSVKLGRGESLCRFAKQVSQNMGEYRQAGDWHYRECCHQWYARTFRRKGLDRISALLSPLTWGEYIIGRLVFGYGERPSRVVAAALVVILGSAVAYTAGGGIWHNMTQQAVREFWCALYFSIVTFTTLGLGDYQPMPDTNIRYFAMVEAFMGAFLMAMFVVALARRWGRG